MTERNQTYPESQLDCEPKNQFLTKSTIGFNGAAFDGTRKALGPA